MKTSLKLIALLSTVGAPFAAAAEFVGARMPSAVTAENMIGLVAVATIGALFVADYSRRSRVLTLAAPARKSSPETHRLAA